MVSVQTLAQTVAPTTFDQDLFTSVRNNDIQGVRAAVIAGADVFGTDAWGNRAADVAVDMGLFDIAHYILSAMDRKRAEQQAPVQQQQAPEQHAQEVLKQTPQPALAASGSQPVVRLVPPPPPLPPSPVSPVSPASPPTSLPPTSLFEPPAQTVRVQDIQLQVQNIALDPAPLQIVASVTPSLDELDPDYKAAPELHVKPEMEPKHVVRATPSRVPPSVPEPTVPEFAAVEPVLTEPDLLQTDAMQQASRAPQQSVPSSIPEPMPTSPVGDHVAEISPQADPTDHTPVVPPTPEPTFDKMQRWFGTMMGMLSEGGDPQLGDTPEPRYAPTLTMALPEPVSRQAQPSSPITNRRDMRLLSLFTLAKTPPVKPASRPLGTNDKEQWPCLEKGRWGVVCLETTSWPEDLRPHLTGYKNEMYRGDKVVAAYKGGHAAVVYAVFPEDRFSAIVAALHHRLGPPDRVSERAIKPFQEAPISNPVHTWYGFDEDVGRDVKLELARYDDRRGTFPVMTDGVLLLSYIGARNIFRYTAPVELQTLN